MNVKELLQFVYSYLGNKENADFSAEILLSSLLKKERVLLFSHDNFTPSAEIQTKFKKQLKQLKNGKPIAYILKNAQFCGNSFYVDKNVLIPRIETEKLVEIGCKNFSKLSKSKDEIFIADVCCGCGNIGISLLLKILYQRSFSSKLIHFDFLDISRKAVQIAEQNFCSNSLNKSKNIRANFIVNDLFYGMKKNYDLILSNPPYISDKEFETLGSSVKEFEPKIALKGGREGLSVIKRLIDWYFESLKLRKLSFLCFEIGSNQAILVKNYFRKCKSSLKKMKLSVKMEIIKDLYGRNRFVAIQSSTATNHFEF